MKPGRVLLFSLLGLLLAQLIAWAQKDASPILSAALTFAGGAIPLVIDYVKGLFPPPEPDQDRPADADDLDHDAKQPNPHRPDEPSWRPRPHRRTAVGLTLGLAGLAFLGAAAYGFSYAVGFITGWEPGSIERLVEDTTGKAGQLSVTVEQVKTGSRYTQLRLTATNAGDVPVNIPLFDNCHISSPKRVTLEPKLGFTTTSGIDVPPHSVPITKDVIFRGTPPESKTSITLTCSTLYWQATGQPRSIQVKKIPLRAR